MPTKALEQLNKRLEDVDRLLEAHRSLSQLRQIKAVSAGQTDLVRALALAQRAFGGPVRGRRWGVAALNRAGIVLLTAHLEGYVEDLFEEGATALASNSFDMNEYDVHAFVAQATGSFRSPKPQNIKDLFTRLGLTDVLGTVQWGNLLNSDVRKRLGDLVALRNEIAHGEQPSVTRAQLSSGVIFVRNLARNLDKRLYNYIQKVAGVRLW
jgi:RiboL-PSP-HEPN